MDNKKVIIVSGGSRGLGKAIVEHLLENQYIVATFSRSKTNYIETLESHDSRHKYFYWQSLNATDYDGVKDFVKSIAKQYGRIDGLVNNAGINLDQLLAVTTDDELNSTLALNLHSVIQLTRAVVRVMLTQNCGSILNISSIIGQRGFKGTAIYSASKAALDGLSRSLCRELGGKNIRVNSIAPGFISTDMTDGMATSKKEQIIRRTPLGRLGRADDIVGIVKFLLSNEADFISGQTITIDGGLTC